MPPARLPTFDYELRRIDGYSGGNPDLDTEVGDTYSLGAVFNGSRFGTAWLANLEVAIDWYRIDLDRAIGRWRVDSAIDRCFDPEYNPGYRNDNIYCSYFTRVPATGDLFATVIDRNIGGRDTSGVDLQLDWSHDNRFGTFALQAYVTHVIDWRLQEPDGREIDDVGTLGSGLGVAIPRLRSLARIAQDWRGFELGLRWEHIGELRDARYRGFVVPERDYLHLEAAYAFEQGALDGLTRRVGIENLADEAPPLYPSWQQANTEPSLYDVLGRRYFVSVHYEI